MKLPGPWEEGYVLDWHSVSSTFLGYEGSIPRFDTKYTELGKLVYQFKYRGDRAALSPIIETVERFVVGLKWSLHCVVPMPPSIKRKSQPVTELAREIAARFGVPAFDTAVVKVKTTPPMKNIEFPSERAEALQGAFRVNPDLVRGKRILLIDDLFEYGSTAGAVANLLLGEGEAAALYMLALTRKRT
jgi:predicted amidophosphoribosyltransferase